MLNDVFMQSANAENKAPMNFAPAAANFAPAKKTAKEINELKARYESIFLSRAMRVMRAINIEALKANNIDVSYAWDQSNGGHWYFNLTFSDTLKGAATQAEEVTDASPDQFSRNALFGIIKADGSVVQYSYENVLKSRIEKAISKVLYERYIDSSNMVEIKPRKAA